MEDFNYEPNTIESDQFLSIMPINLMKENIKSQFEDPLEHKKKDHISTFIDMYKFSEANADPYEDEDLANFIELRDGFYGFMQQMFDDYLGIGFNNFDDKSKEDQDDLIHFTYRFFLMNIKKNFVCLILNCIEANRGMYENDDKKKDVTTLTFKREVTDPTDVYILSNLYEIINDILSKEFDTEEFFKLCDNEDTTLETEFVSNAFENFDIVGNFVPHYINMLDSDFKSEIESKVRNKILKKYKKI